MLTVRTVSLWRQQEGFTALRDGPLPPPSQSPLFASSVSGNGTRFAGYIDGYPDPDQLFLLDVDSGYTVLENPPGGSATSPLLARDGETLGCSVLLEDWQAMLWRSETHWTPVFPADAPARSVVNAINGNGSVVAGWANFPEGQKTYRWTPASGGVALEMTPAVWGVSDDGRVITGSDGEDVWIWTVELGERRLSNVLALTGYSEVIEGRALHGGALSGGGNVVVGWASEPQDWKLAVPFRVDLDRIGWAEWNATRH